MAVFIIQAFNTFISLHFSFPSHNPQNRNLNSSYFSTYTSLLLIPSSTSTGAHSAPAAPAAVIVCREC